MNIRDRIKELKRVPANELRPNPRNWRTHPDAQKTAMKAMLEEVGFAGAVLAYETDDGNLQTIDGHLRQDLCLDSEVPVLVLDVNAAEANKILATYDPISAMAGVDAETLAELASGIDFDNSDAEAFFDDLAAKHGIGGGGDVKEDEPPPVQEEAITREGDVWMLGRHRLLCGDSSDADAVRRLMCEKKCRLIATDPPYGVNYESGKYCPTSKNWDSIANDEKQGGALRDWLTPLWSLWLSHCYGDASFYSWTAAMEEGAAAAAMRDAGIHIQSQIIWVKNALVLGQADYQWRHENCWYGFLKGKKHRWTGGRSQTTVWEVSKVHQSQYVHPMQKPVELYAIPIKNHTGEGDVVAEPFAGSGTQFVAAEQLDRTCYGMELSPNYCDVIIRRWQNLTGEKATNEETGEVFPGDTE